MNGFGSLCLEYFGNALWLVPLVYLAAKLLAHWTQRYSAQLAHRVWVSALVLQSTLPAMSLLPVRDFRWCSGLFHFGQQATHGNGARISLSFGDGNATGGLGLSVGMLHGIEAAYVAITLFFLVQMLWGVWRVHELRANARMVEPSELPGLCTPQLATSLRALGVRVAISAAVRGPATIGARDKLLILPEGFACISDEDKHAALAHELAHVRRHDFAKNLLYCVLRCPIAFHPAMRSTLRNVAETREMVCDSIAAEAAAGSQEYAKSLLRLAARFTDAKPNAHVYAIGIFDANTLERRLTMLTAKQKRFSFAQRLALGTITVVLAVGAFTSAGALRLHVFSGEVQTAASTERAVPVPADVIAGTVLTQVNPIYPEDARAAKITGAVVLHVIIGQNGAIQDLHVVSGPPELTRSAIDAVHQWTYKPYRLNGNPTSVETTITVNYQLNP